MSNRIKGITVEIGGDTSGLEKALSDVNNSIKKTQSQLRDVNNLLKLDPKNTVLLAQKQELLQSAIGDTEKKLQALEQAQEEVTKAFERGDLGKDQYMAFQREVEETRGTLNRYKADLFGLQSEQERLFTNTDRLSKLFAATESNVDDYADVLGSKLVNAIKNGTASSDQLKTAIEKIGRSASGGKADIRQLTDALDTVDDGQAVRNLIENLNNVGDAAQDAAGDIGEIAEATKGTALMEAADQLSAVGDKIQDIGDKAVSVYAETENAVTKVNAYFGETGAAAEASAEVVKDIYGAGVGDSMESVADAVIMVKKNLGELSDTDLTNLTQQALTLDELYGIDMNETLRGVNALMKQYGMTAQEAMDYIVKGTQNGLDKTNELGDNLSEYSGKFAQAGYSASEYFQLLQNGLQGGAYNLDKVNDAINEVTTRLADGTISDSIGLYSQKTQELFTSWQKGGATQKQVIDSIVADIASCSREQQALNMAAEAFGTMAEDGNLKFITSLTSVGEAYESVKGSAEGMFDSTTTPMQEMEANTRKLQQSLVPLGEKLLELANTVLPPLMSIISAVSEIFSFLPEPVQNFVVILGALLAAFTALVPIIAALSVSIGALNISLLPIIGIIAAVAAVIAVIIAVVKNWGAITEWFGQLWEKVTSKLTSLWEGIKSTAITVWNAIKEFFIGIWDGIKSLFSAALEAVKTLVATYFNLYKTIISTVINAIKTVIQTAWNLIKAAFEAVLGVIKTVVTTYFNVYKTIVQTVLNVIKTVVTNVWNTIKTIVTTVLNAIKTVFSTVWEAIKSIISSVLTAVKALVSGDFEEMKSAVSSIMNTIKNTISSIWNTIKSTFSASLGAIKDAVSNIFNGILSAVKNAMTGVFNAVKNGFSNVKDHITGLASKAFTWGKDLVMGLVNGIKSCIGAVGDAVSSVADKISSFLHFSVPDEGPLSEYESWMPDFMKGLAEGIEKSRSLIKRAAENVSGDLVLNPDVRAESGNFESAKAYDFSGLVSAIENLGQRQNATGGDIVIPVYLGGTMLDEVIITAQQRANLRSGGR